MHLRNKLLLIEPDMKKLQALNAALAEAGYQTITAQTGKQALELISSHCPDCILLELALPDQDGLDVIRSVRRWTSTPIITFSKPTSDENIALILDTGADDYLPKPCSNIELTARIRTALRHTQSGQNADIALNGCLEIGALKIDYRKHRVFRNDLDVQLTPNEFKIVALLGQYAGQVVSYQTMMRELWGPAAGRDNKILRVHMTSIRRKLEPVPEKPIYFFTENGVGYRLIDHLPE